MIKKLIKKAIQSPCKFKIAAVGISKKGNILGYSTNQFRFVKYSGGLHAERLLMNKFKGSLHKIIICRVNNSGELLPIEPCHICQKIAKKLGIRIESI